MDPFGLSGNLTANVVVKLSKVCKAWRDAPDTICAVHNELVDLQLVLQLCDEAFHQLSENVGLPLSTSLAIAQKHARDLKNCLQELEGIIDFCLRGSLSEIRPSSERAQQAKVRTRWVKKQSQASSIQQSLRESRNRLNSVLQACNVSTSAHVYGTLDVLLESHAQLQADFRRFLATGSGSLPTTQPTINDTRHGGDQLVANLHTSLAPRGAEPNSDDPERAALANAAGITSQQIVLTSSHSPVHALRVCNWNCPCCCHKPNSFRTPVFAEPLLGSLFVGYTAMPYVSFPCNDSACGKRARGRGLLYYRFPAWLCTGIVLAAKITNTANLGPELLLRVPRTIECWSFFIYDRHRFDEDAVDFLRKELSLDRTLAAHQDSDGDTLLLFLLQYRTRLTNNEGIVRLLLQNGADIDHMALDGTSVRSLGLEQGLTPKGLSYWRGILQMGGEYDETASTLGFTPLHTSAFYGDLEVLGKLIDKASTPINSRDYKGRTPLHIAVEHQSVSYVTTLLAYGANALAFSSNGRTTLHYAVKRNDPEIVRLIASHYKDVDVRDNQGETPFMSACRLPTNHSILKALLDKGADINAKDKNGCTSLMDECVYAGPHSQANVPWLLEHGANVNERTLPGFTALLYCIFYRNAQFILPLLTHGAQYDISTKGGHTLLDMVAIYPSFETVEALLGGNLKFLDVDTLDKYGCTARQWAIIESYRFEDRQKGKQWLSLFDKLIRKIRRDTLSARVENGTHLDGLQCIFSGVSHIEENLSTGMSHKMPGQWID